jgi:hypothetical protein
MMEAMMMMRWIPWLAALAAAVAVGLWVATHEAEVAWRNAMGEQRLCYANAGYPLGSGPAGVAAECAEPVIRYSQSTWFYVAGAGAGLVAALVVLAIFAVVRRKRPAA